MNPAGGLPEKCEDHGIRREGPRQLHAVNELVGRYPMQHQLTGVGIFPFVPLQREAQKSYAYEAEENHCQTDKYLRAPGLE